MNIIVISQENKILHITSFGLQAEYTLYNSKGHYLYSGILESVYEAFEEEQLLKEIINLIQDYYTFSEPYIYLQGSDTVPILSLIKSENNKKSKKELLQYIKTLSKENDYFYCERWQYV